MNGNAWSESSFVVGEWQVHPSLNRIERAGRSIDIDPCPMAVLLHLAKNAGRVVSADELVEHVWDGRCVSDSPVYKAVAQLRKAMGDDAHEPRFIETISKRGYRLIAVTDIGAVENAAVDPVMESASHRPMIAASLKSRFFHELRRRRVISTVAIYIIAVAFIIVGLLVMKPVLPSWVLRAVIAVALVGLPIVSVLAWIFDVKRTDTSYRQTWPDH